MVHIAVNIVVSCELRVVNSLSYPRKCLHNIVDYVKRQQNGKKLQ